MGCHNPTLLAPAERSRFVRQHFTHDPADAGLYHVLLNMERVGAEAAARVIATLVA